MQISPKVKQKLQSLPDSPGVYIMRDRHGQIIYIGKAASLRKRVQSYFRRSTLRSARPKLRGLVKSIDDLEYLAVRTEAEATLTEGRMIKEYRPRYNVTFRDDKRFLLLRINLSDPFPRLQTCRIDKNDGAHYFGPYASAQAARAAMEFAEKRFGIRACSPIVPDGETYKHCMNDIIRYCAAPCIGKVSREEYMGRVGEAVAFLRGERKDCLTEIQEQMEKASAAMDFERAAALRDTLFLLRDAMKRKVRGMKSLEMKNEDARRGVKELKAALQLPTMPRVIECFDISNISGTHAVASMVCAVDGMPQKSRYRSFRIKTIEGIDDPAMMGEVIRRRYSRVSSEENEMPDLVLVDGGITQMRSARARLNELGLSNIPVVGLAKRFEEVYRDRDDGKQPLRLPTNSAGLLVLQRIRDEAHRFALTYHRKLRSRRISESVLDDIPGIGKKRKEQLLAHFGSIRRLRNAAIDEIAAVPGFGKATAKLVAEELDRLHG
ncbi:MAG: excinuclease ABC subunit UvrC [Verrucomicrobia bacterium]|nr:excinuclease ABC subunit UvrC [Verrucomicrobiota bacterium]